MRTFEIVFIKIPKVQTRIPQPPYLAKQIVHCADPENTELKPPDGYDLFSITEILPERTINLTVKKDGKPGLN